MLLKPFPPPDPKGSGGIGVGRAHTLKEKRAVLMLTVVEIGKGKYVILIYYLENGTLLEQLFFHKRVFKNILNENRLDVLF